jgi:hypothetical protein
MAKSQNLDPKDYYQSLTKKEKSRFLRYLSQRYDYPSATMSGKLRENPASDLRRDERENIIKTIEEGLWRQ